MSFIHPMSYVESGAFIGRDCMIGACVYIADCVHIEDDCVIEAGSIIGTRAFVFDKTEDGWERSYQVGGVHIESGTEIGALCTINRGETLDTHVGKNTKIDSQVHLGHDVRIGKNVFIAAQTGIAGYTVVGDDVVIAGQVAIRDHLHIGNGAVIAARSGVAHDVAAGAMVWGTPARALHEEKKIQAMLTRMPAMFQFYKEARRRQEKTRGAA